MPTRALVRSWPLEGHAHPPETTPTRSLTRELAKSQLYEDHAHPADDHAHPNPDPGAGQVLATGRPRPHNQRPRPSRQPANGGRARLSLPVPTQPPASAPRAQAQIYRSGLRAPHRPIAAPPFVFRAVSARGGAGHERAKVLDSGGCADFLPAPHNNGAEGMTPNQKVLSSWGAVIPQKRKGGASTHSCFAAWETEIRGKGSRPAAFILPHACLPQFPPWELQAEHFPTGTPGQERIGSGAPSGLGTLLPSRRLQPMAGLSFPPPWTDFQGLSGRTVGRGSSGKGGSLQRSFLGAERSGVGPQFPQAAQGRGPRGAAPRGCALGRADDITGPGAGRERGPERARERTGLLGARRSARSGSRPGRGARGSGWVGRPRP